MQENPEIVLTEQFISFFNSSGEIQYSFIRIRKNENKYLQSSQVNPCCSILGMQENACAMCPLEVSLKTGNEFEVELQSVDSQWWTISSAPAFDVQGKLQGVFMFGKNSSLAKFHKAQAENSEEKYRLLFENSQEAIFIVQDDKFVFYNQKLSEITGYSKEELRKLTVNDVISKTKSNAVFLKLGKQRKEISVSNPIEIEINSKDNKELWISITTVNIEWENKPAILSFAYDITAKTVATQLLIKRDTQYRMLVENQTDLIVNTDKEGKLIYVSPSYCELFDKSEDELIGKSFMPLVHADDRLSTSIEFKKLSSPPHTCYMEQRAFTIKGWRWIAWSDKALVDENGNIISITGVGRDINEHKLAEIALLESERRLATLMANLPGMVYRCKNDKHWTMEFVSNGCYDLTGYSKDDLINSQKLSFNDIIHPDFRDKIWLQWQEAINEKQSYQGEYQIVTAKGNIKWVFEQGQAIFNPYGETIALEGFIQDITARKITDEELLLTTEKYRNLIDTALLGIYTTTLEGKLIFANEALVEMIGYTIEDAYELDSVIQLYKNPDDRLTLLSDLIKYKKLSNCELTWIHKNGNEITVLLSAILSDKQLTGMVMDITHRKQAENEVLKAKEKAEESDKLKSAFLSNISHEIRTPINGIIGFIDIILDEETDKEQKSHYADIVRKLSNQLLSIVNDVIEISKIETNQIVIRKSRFKITDCLKEVYNQYVKTSSKNNNQFLFLHDIHENIFINSDANYIKQILGYLIDNALKFTNNGMVEFGFREKEKFIEFYVKDNGIGINPKNHHLIFDRFRQIEEPLTRKYNGSGLGLAITKALVEMLGGSITLISEEGAGSEFSFCIPYQNEDSRNDEADGTIGTLKNKTILVCDDDDFGYLYIRKVLTKAGLICIRAEDGPSAIKHFNNNPAIDVIIMDMRLPGMSGVEATEILREKDKSIPILGFTAYAADDIDALKSKNLFNGFIFKPVDVPALIHLLRSFF